MIGRVDRRIGGRARLAGVIAVCFLAPAVAAAQTPGIDGRAEVVVNSELERYLRLLQISGTTPLYPWSIRGFSPREVDLLAPVGDHPWAQRFRLGPAASGPLQLSLIRPRSQVIFNSAFPHGPNLGPVWAGRGFTGAFQAGVAGRVGPLSAKLAPIVFGAENREFPLMPNGAVGRLLYADGRRFADNRSPLRIDLPQRFGDETYSRLDPGESYVRVDLPFLAAGVSTANQHWGPATEHPIVLGNNAPGYLHGFLGTGSPLDLWIARVHGRLVWGRLEQSAYSPAGAGRRERFTSALVVALSPRGIDGLELGMARMFHEAWPQGGLRFHHFVKPAEAFFKTGLAGDGNDGSDPDNQLASVFFRWVLPRSGFEAFGEFGRYDHNWDFRDFVLEPDHLSAYLLGFQKAWQLPERRMVTLRGELLNTAVSHLHQVRTAQVPYYVHGRQRQGHTHHGQILGSAAGYGGGGSIVAADLYHGGGRIGAYWSRELRQEYGQYWWAHDVRDAVPDAIDVIHALGADALLFRGGWELRVGLAGLYNLNRDYGDDVFNVQGTLELRAGW